MYDQSDPAENDANTVALIAGGDSIADILDYQGGPKVTYQPFTFPISGDVIAAEGHLWTTAQLWPMVHESTDEGLDSGDGYFGMPRQVAWQAVVDQSMGRRYYLGYTLYAGYSSEHVVVEECRSMMSALVLLQSLMLDHGDALTRARLASRIG